MSTEGKLHKAMMVLRILFAWFFIYAGLTKIFNPHYSAVSFLLGSKVFTPLYHWFASSTMIGFINFTSEWLILALGVFILFGFLPKWTAWVGFVLMFLFYFPKLNPFPFVQNGFLVNDDIFYAVVFLVLLYSGTYQRWNWKHLIGKKA